MKFELENHKFFPVVAWILVIGFATFTFSLAYKLQNEAGPLQMHNTLTEQYLRQ